MNDIRPHVTVTDDPAQHVFVATLDDGTQAGGAYYQRHGDVVIFTHTEVPSELEGRGIASQLAAGALDAVRATGQKMVPLCPFIRAYVGKHPEYDDLLQTYTDLGSRVAGPGAPAQA